MTTKKKRESNPMSGKKICPECAMINGARQRKCKYCKYQFPFKNYKIKNEVLNWQELEKGELIKIVSNTGPYYDLSESKHKETDADRHNMGAKGIYKVMGIDDTGILCYGASTGNAGFCHIYMGSPYKSKITGINFEPHRITKVKSKKLAELDKE